MLLTVVPYYRVERDEDGRPSREFDRVFTMALRWWPEVDIPEEMVSSTSRKRGDEPVHAGAVALHLLRDANDISQRQLNAAQAYLLGSLAYYESLPAEPYPGRNEEAAADLRALLAEINQEAG